MQIFIGGIGCFWDETEYQGIPGIISTECGYCGGKNSTVTYEQVCGGDTEHIEVVLPLNFCLKLASCLLVTV